MAIGDVTGDGHVDLAVGAMHEGSEHRGEHGAISVYPGGAGGLGAAHVIGGPIGGGLEILASTLGERLTIADVNGDGFGDALAGRHGPAEGRSRTCRAARPDSQRLVTR